jgi:hypothetical protein
MTKTATARRISRLHAYKPGDASWRAQQAQVDGDIEGLSCDPDADRRVAEMDASGIEPRKQIESLKAYFRRPQMGHTRGGA